MNQPSPTMRTMTVSWHENAVKRAVANAKAMLDHGIDDTPIVRSTPGVPLTWQDVAVLVDIARTLDEDCAELQKLRKQLQHYQDTEGYRLAIEQILDGALGPNAEDGTGEGIAADVAYVVRQRDEARAEANDLHDRARHVREDNEEGYARHREELIKALGQHADPTARTIQQLIQRDVAALAEAYDTVEAELIEWRTGQRAVEASVMQWKEITGRLDETLAAVRILTAHLTDDEQLRGELPTGGDPCPVGVGGGPDGDDFAPCNQPAAPGLEVCAEHADGPVVETTAEPEFPSAGLRATGTDLDGRTVTGTIVGFFAWSNETSKNERAHLDLDDGTKTVVTTASLRAPGDPEPLRFTHDSEDE